MQVATFIDHLATDFEHQFNVHYGLADNLEPEFSSGSVPNQYILDTVAFVRSMPGRFSHQKWEFLDFCTDLYKDVMSHLCQDTPFGVTPKRSLAEKLTLGCRSLPPHLRGMVLDLLSWSQKLTFAGKTMGLPDVSGFKQRSREAEALTDFRASALASSNQLTLIRSLTKIRRSAFRPKHGPGATYEKLHGWDKYLALETAPRPLCRLSAVPKDRRKARLIAIEHAHMQWMQQGLAALIRDLPWFRKHINIGDQQKHIAFCVDGILAGHDMVTIDLKDASDRIPPALVAYLLPHLYADLACATSHYALVPFDDQGNKLPQPEIIRLGMMCNMGCGFCFELETLVFHLVASLAIAKHHGTSLLAAASRVRVYGDDVVIRAADYSAVQLEFTKLGWVINQHKTGLTNSFLETCGTYIMTESSYDVHNGVSRHVVTRRRLCPSLRTVDRRGMHTALDFRNDQLAALRFGVLLRSNGFQQAAVAVVRESFSGSRARFTVSIKKKDQQCYQHPEIRATTQREVTRPLNVVPETRYRAYWESGLVDQLEEPCGQQKCCSAWYPISSEDELGLLEESFPEFRQLCWRAAEAFLNREAHRPLVFAAALR